jgi:hypothetical protein
VYVVTLHLAAVLLILQTRLGDHPKVLDFSALSYIRQLFMVELWSKPYFDDVAWDGPAWSISAECWHTCFPCAGADLVPVAATGAVMTDTELTRMDCRRTKPESTDQ